MTIRGEVEIIYKIGDMRESNQSVSSDDGVAKNRIRSFEPRAANQQTERSVRLAGIAREISGDVLGQSCTMRVPGVSECTHATKPVGHQEEHPDLWGLGPRCDASEMKFSIDPKSLD